MNDERINKNIFIFLGPPGSGKGSISKLCQKRLGWTQFSTGNLCRQHIAEQTEIGKQIDLIIKSGKLINDELIIEMVDSWLRDLFERPASVILDGFPRTVAQAQALDKLLASESFSSVNVSVIKFDVPDEYIVERLVNRFTCQNNKCQAVFSLNQASGLQPKIEMTCDECSSPLMRRQDDEESAIRERLRIYYDHERTIVSYYKEAERPLYHIEGTRQIEQVYQQLMNSTSTAL